jgi:hypothetical protein
VPVEGALHDIDCNYHLWIFVNNYIHMDWVVVLGTYPNAG